jgi:hypothetical protein
MGKIKEDKGSKEVTRPFRHEKQRSGETLPSDGLLTNRGR